MQARQGFWRRTPPAIFPPIFGLLGLGLAWRRAGSVFGVSDAPAEIILGMATPLFLLALVAYAAKLVRRPGVVVDDLRILPGRAGLAAMTLSLMLFASVLTPYWPEAGRLVLFAGLIVHLGLAALVVRVFVTGPAEQRRVTPVWHLSFVGFIVGAMSAAPLGYAALAETIFWVTLPIAALVWAESLRQFVRAGVPAPLRPLLAIHLAPACLLGTVAMLTGHPDLAAVFAWGGLALVVLLASAGFWITRAGFSPLWGAFTFPLAAFAGLALLMAGHAGGGAWRVIGGVALIAATLIIPPIVWKVMQLWAKGTLAVKTNAAAA